MPRIAVIIPTLNRPDSLQACLQALSDNFPCDAEVIVVSDGGDREQFPDLTRFEACLNLKVIHAPHGGPAHARNIGLEHTEAPIVAFTDDDCLPQADWLSTMAEHVSMDPPVAVAGSSVNGLPDSIYAAAYQLVLDIAERDQKYARYSATFYPSNNLAFPAAALQAIGGFDVNFQTAEDREVCRRWLQSGHDLKKVPQARLAHAPRLTLTSFWNKFVSHGKGAAQYHRSSTPQQPGVSLGFHFRVPFHAFSEASLKKLRHPIRTMALLVVWEFANLWGFTKAKSHQHKNKPDGTGESET